MVPTPGGLPNAVLWDVDLFASRLNRKVERFVARTRDPLADASDALVAPWHQYRLMYAFPPIQLLSRFLRRLVSEPHMVILVAPDWPRRSWYADVVHLAVAPPWRLPLREDLLSQGPIFHPALQSLALTAWLLRPRS